MKALAGLSRRMVVAGGALAAAVSLTGASVAQEVSFAGKTVDIMVNFAAGSGTDTAARLVAPYIAKNLPGNPGYIVTNKGGAGGTAAVDYLISSVAPDGLHIGYFAGTPLRWSLGMQQVPDGTGDLPYVAGRSVNQIFVTRSELGLNADTLKGYSKPIFMAINSPDNHVAIRARLLTDALGVKKFEVVGGYPAQGNMVAAVRASEADVAQTNDSFFGANRDAITADGFMVPLGQMGEYGEDGIVAQQGLEDIPVFDAMWRAGSPETVGSPAYRAWETFHIAMSIQNVFVLPPNTPAEFVPVWEQAILKGYSDPEYLKQLTDVGVPVPAGVGTEAVRKRMARLHEAFSDPEVRAVIEGAIARNMQ